MVNRLVQTVSLSTLLMVSVNVLAVPYKTVGDFLDSGKIIQRETGDGYKFAVKDKKGKIRTSFDYDFILPVAQTSNGILAGKNGKKGTLDSKTFQEKIPFIYDVLGAFNYKIDIVIATKDGKTGAIDSHNHVKIPFIYRMIAFNLKALQGFSEQVTIATPVDNQQDYLMLTADNQVVKNIKRLKGLENFYVNDFDGQLIALSDDYNNAVLMDWHGKVILNSKLGKPMLNYNSVMFTDYEKNQTVTMSYTIDDKGNYHFRTESASSMTIR